MTPLCSIHGEERVRGCDECWTLMSDRLAESKANAPHVYAYAFRAGVEAAAKWHTDRAVEFRERARKLREEENRLLIAEHRDDMAGWHDRIAEQIRAALSQPAEPPRERCACPVCAGTGYMTRVGHIGLDSSGPCPSCHGTGAARGE